MLTTSLSQHIQEYGCNCNESIIQNHMRHFRRRYGPRQKYSPFKQSPTKLSNKIKKNHPKIATYKRSGTNKLFFNNQEMDSCTEETKSEEEEQSFVVLKVNVRLNILNKNDVVRQKEQSLVLKVPVEKLNNEATLDIHLEDGVELANLDILEMDQELELAEIDIIKLEIGENLNDKISEALSKKTENSELIDKLAEELEREQIRFQQEQEQKREQELKQAQFDSDDDDDSLNTEELIKELKSDDLNPKEAFTKSIRSDRLESLKLEKIIEEEEGTNRSTTDADWEEEIDWEEEEAEWDNNEDEEKQWEKFDSELDSLLDPIWSQKEINSFLSSSSMFSSVNRDRDGSLEYDEEEEYFTDLDDKTITTTPLSFDEWEDFAVVGKTPPQLNNRPSIAIENKAISEEKRLLSVIENIFQLIDYDHNGMIEFNDIIRVIFILNYLLGRNYSKTDAVIFFTTLDQDKDGKLDRKEFKSAFNYLFI